jgi:hypothetical protein
MFALIVWQAVAIPFKLCFDNSNSITDKSATYYIDMCIDIFFVLDMLFAFNTGFFKNGVLILNRKLIVVNYILSWFLIDLLATFPYVYVVQWVSPVGS